MKKIGLFLGASLGGGIFQYSVSILKAMSALPKDRFEVVCAYWDPVWGSQLEAMGIDGIQIERGYVGRAVWRIWDWLNLPLLWWREIAHVVHPAADLITREKCRLWIFPAQDYFSYFAKVPALTSIHDLMHRYERRFPEVSENGVFQERERKYAAICQFSAGILVDSETGKKHVHDCYGYSLDKIHILPYVPSPSLFADGLKEASYLESFLPDRFVFYPAQFWKHKNHVGIIRAIDLLKTAGMIVNAVFVGSEKNSRGELQTLVKDLDLGKQIVFLDYVADHELVYLYKRAVALVMPTFFGPTNIPPLEAFALGCPVVTSDIYGMAEQLGDAALLVNPAETPDIADKIRMVWTDETLRANLITRGFARHRQWTQEGLNQQFCSILDRATNLTIE